MNGHKKILIVDDDEFLRSIYVEIFKQGGYEVLEAKDGLEGLKLALANLPQFIFTGIMMPKVDGFEMVSQLKENVATAKIPFAIFSHLGREEDRIKARQVGAVAFLVKGNITPKEILKYVSDYLNQYTTFKVGIDMTKYDGEKLKMSYPGFPEMALELERDPEQPNTFKAKLV